VPTDLTPREIVQDAIDSIDSILNAAILDHYSGRGMGGESCLAVQLDSLNDLLILGMAITASVLDRADSSGEASAEIDEMIIKFARSNRDQLGHNVVVYWPYLPAN